MTRLFTQKPTSEAQAFFAEASSFPRTLAAIAMLAAADVAIACSVILSVG